MGTNLCLITARSILAIYYYVSGVAISRLALLCGNRFGVPRLSWRALIMCINSRMLSYV